MGPGRSKVLAAVPVTAGAEGKTIDAVARDCGVSYSTARVHLRELRRAGLVQRMQLGSPRRFDVYHIAPAE